MSWVIALEEGLEDIREYLRNKGLHVVDWSNKNIRVDAVVYRGRSLSAIQSEQIMSATDQIYDYTGENSFGVLLVNAQNKTPQEVYEIIKNRVYEHFI
ncbi:MAG: YkuS family protein [Thermoanaerobacteraceae bacterium]|nr:YkuS family protein [Thermoanaerobacteraceae bacterium]